MKVHHLNCISACPLGGRLMDGQTRSLFERGLLSSHCLLVETARGLVLVDTGYGLEDVRHPHKRLSEFFLLMNAPDFKEEMTALRQIEQLGFSASDVRDIVLTHLDFDHAGGLDDFPNATVHMLEDERTHAQARQTWLDKQRYRPAQWSTAANWKTYRAESGDSWFGFESLRPLAQLSSQIALVPLIGHTLGHCGVAVESDAGWLLLAGDAYFYVGEMNVDAPSCTPGLAFYQWLMQKDRGARLHNQRRLRELKKQHGSQIEIFCSHDPIEFERLAARSIERPTPTKQEVLAPNQEVLSAV